MPRKAAKSTTPRVFRMWRRHFRNWDSNGDGRITENEYWKSLRDTRVTGDEAAALATLIRYQKIQQNIKGTKSIPSLSKKALRELTTDAEGGAIFQTNFERDKARLRRSSKSLFTQKGFLRSESIDQYESVQCGFLAALYPIVRDTPEKIKEMIHGDPESGFTVNFPGVSEPVEVSPLTDTELIIHTNALENGQWLSLLEKAWGQWNGNRETGPMVDFTHPMDAVSGLKGTDGKTTFVPQSTKAQPGETPRFLKTTERNLNEGAVVVVNVPKGDVHTDGIVDHHYYTVTGWDSTNHMLWLRNPHGHGEPVNRNGNPRDGKDDGHFGITLDEFMDDFRSISRELPSKTYILDEPPALIRRRAAKSQPAKD